MNEYVRVYPIHIRDKNKIELRLYDIINIIALFINELFM